MLLEPLVSTIEMIKERIATHGPSLRQNETRTRMALIDPLLQSLGWDSSDPALVTPEYRVDVGWADYALLGAGNKPAAVIEAKRLGSVVENHLEQAVGYCIQQGIPYVGVTDGDHWQLYRTFEPVPLVEKLVLDVSVASTPTHEAALKLLLLWQRNLASGQPVAAEAPVLVSRLDDSLLSTAPLVNREQPDLVNPTLVQPPSSVAYQQEVMPQPGGLAEATSTKRGWLPLSEIKPKGGDAPNSIRFPDSMPIEINRGWADAWFRVCEWLASTGKLTELDCPISISERASRYLVHTVPVHSNERPFGQARKTATDLFVELQYDPKQVLRNARFLLGKFKVPADTVELQFE